MARVLLLGAVIVLLVAAGSTVEVTKRCTGFSELKRGLLFHDSRATHERCTWRLDWRY